MPVVQTMIELLTMMLLPAMVVLAGVGDFLTMRIPNWLNVVIALSVFPMAWLAGMPFEVFQWHLVTGTLVLVASFGLFAGGVIGGGDAKLFAATALWMGWPQVVPFLIVTTLAGGVLAVVMKFWQAVRIEHEVKNAAWLKQVIRSNLDLPYGVAIAAGCVATYPQTWWMQSLL